MQMRYLYTLCLYLALPFILLRLLWRSRHIPAYRQRWPERFGYIHPITPQGSIWLHAVSLGETIAAAPLVNALLARYPDYPLIITSMTPTGSAQVIQQFGDRVKHAYVPYDLPMMVKRFLKSAQPELCIIMETELWPNLLHYSKANNVALFLANARLSERSCRGYQRISRLTRPMLQSFTAIAAQSPEDAKRFEQLGPGSDNITITGNIKFDLQLPPSLAQEGKNLRQPWGARPVFIAASTHAGEENIILDAFSRIQQQHPSVLLLLVPRHPDRFKTVAELCKTKGYSVIHRSRHELPQEKTDIILGDSLGELCLFYAASDIAFVGGSLVPVGGHNLIEPAALGLPIISGPELHHFAAIKDILKESNALTIVNNATELAETVTRFLSDAALAQEAGNRAHSVSLANRGALKKHMQLIEAIL